MITHRRNKKTTRRNKNKKLRSKKIKHTQTRASNKKTIKKYKKNQKGGINFFSYFERDISGIDTFQSFYQDKDKFKLNEILDNACTDITKLKSLFRILFQIPYRECINIEKYLGRLRNNFNQTTDNDNDKNKYKLIMTLIYFIKFMSCIKNYDIKGINTDTDCNKLLQEDIICNESNVNTASSEDNTESVSSDGNTESGENAPKGVAKTLILKGSLGNKINCIINNSSIDTDNNKIIFNVSIKRSKIYNFLLNKSYINKGNRTSSSPSILLFINKHPVNVNSFLRYTYYSEVSIDKNTLMLKIKGFLPEYKKAFQESFNIINLSSVENIDNPISLSGINHAIGIILNYPKLKTFKNYNLYMLFFLLSYYEMCLEFKMWLLMDEQEIVNTHTEETILNTRIQAIKNNILKLILEEYNIDGNIFVLDDIQKNILKIKILELILGEDIYFSVPLITTFLPYIDINSEMSKDKIMLKIIPTIITVIKKSDTTPSQITNIFNEIIKSNNLDIKENILDSVINKFILSEELNTNPEELNESTKCVQENLGAFIIFNKINKKKMDFDIRKYERYLSEIDRLINRNLQKRSKPA